MPCSNILLQKFIWILSMTQQLQYHQYQCHIVIYLLSRLLIAKLMSASPTNSQILAHQVGQSVAWEILLNITVILALLKHSWSAAFLHMAIGFCILFITYFFILWYLIPFGFIQSQKEELVYYLHAIIGCAMLGFIILLVSSGMFTKFARDSVFSKSLKNVIKKFHIIFAYFIIVLFKINILFNWFTTNKSVFAALVAWDVFFLLVWAYLKFFNQKLESTVIDMRTKIASDKTIQEVGSLAQIQGLKHPYVIYNGYVYDATKVINHHPGGQKVISSILGREVDRFLYGMYSSELVPEIPPHSHSTGALTLLREPVLKIVIPSPFKDFSEATAVKVQFMNEVSKNSKIYVVGLAAARGEFQFSGYSDVRQLGQFYSLTMGESVTRLYTAVNFMNRHNIRLLNELIPTLKYDIEEGKTWRSKKSDLTELREMVNNSNKERRMIDDSEVDLKKYLPIMLKIYQNGKFTSKLTSVDPANLKLQLSPPKGLGLELDVTKPGRIVIVTGGTGLFPFCDFIDLLYKSIYLEQTKSHKTEILQNDPILKSDPFKKYIFILLAAINDAQDLHPITYHQLAFLSRHPSRFKVVLRVSKDEQTLKRMESKIQFTRDYFTNRVITESTAADFSRVWICGPPKMCTDVAETLLNSGYARDSFLLL